jgi:hypothetical protein
VNDLEAFFLPFSQWRKFEKSLWFEPRGDEASLDDTAYPVWIRKQTH